MSYLLFRHGLNTVPYADFKEVTLLSQFPKCCWDYKYALVHVVLGYFWCCKYTRYKTVFIQNLLCKPVKFFHRFVFWILVVLFLRNWGTSRWWAIACKVRSVGVGFWRSFFTPYSLLPVLFECEEPWTHSLPPWTALFLLYFAQHSTVKSS